MKYNGFYFWMFQGPMKKVLAEQYGKAYAAEIMKKKQDGLSSAGGTGGRHRRRQPHGL